MTNSTAKKANRGHLKRAAAKGQLWIRCRYSYTDDYAWDAADNFGKQDEFYKVYIMEDYQCDLNAREIRDMPCEEREFLIAKANEKRREHYNGEEKKAKEMGAYAIDKFYFEKGTRVNGDTESGTFYVHSNLCYEYEIRK